MPFNTCIIKSIRRTRAIVDWRIGRPVRHRLAQRWGHPTVRDMLEVSGGRLAADIDDFISFFGDESPYLRAEFEELRSNLRSRPSTRQFDKTFDVGSHTAWALYNHIRSHSPLKVVETGVANGISTFFILSALRANGVGTLHSVDVSENVASVLNAAERQEWDLRVLPAEPTRRDFERAVTGLDNSGLFIHDSDHSYKWMRTEFIVARDLLAPGGWIASDDADASYSFAQFCAEDGLDPMFLMDGTKFFGAAQTRQ